MLTRRNHHRYGSGMPSHAGRTRCAAAIHNSRTRQRHAFANPDSSRAANCQANCNADASSYRHGSSNCDFRKQSCTSHRNEPTRLNSYRESHAYSDSATACQLRTQGLHIHL